MGDYLDRIYHFKGSPRQVGLAAGRALGDRLEQTISRYIASQPVPKDLEKLRAGALPWLRSLPPRFQEEFEGLAEGAAIPIERLAEFDYIEECDVAQCSGAVVQFDGRAWVARNNDAYVPELWGYVTIREVDGRIPTIGFSMEGDIFTPTGINQEKLWLHYNYLPAWDKPSPAKLHYPAYVFLTEALERCRSIRDVEALLDATGRDGGMLLFAVDGKTNEAALFECTCSTYYKRQPADGWIVGTNHFCACEDRTLGDADSKPLGTLSRYRRMEALVQPLAAAPDPPDLPAGLIRVLADDGIERREQRIVTVYSNVACPATGELWYTFGGYPAASKGNWQRLEWPWCGFFT